MKEYFLESRGIAYRTNDIHVGRPTLLFVHGFSGSASAWYPFEEALEHSCNIVTFDVRGHGLSVRPRSFAAYAVEQSAQDMHALCTELGLSSVTVVSHSLGSLIALRFMLMYPALTERAISISSVYGIDSMVRVRMTRALLWLSAGLATLLPNMQTRGLRTTYSSYIGTGDWNVRRISADIRNMGLRSAIFSLTHIYREHSDSRWKHIAAQTLLIHGAKDSVIPLNHARLLQQEIPHAELKVIEKGNHILVLNEIPSLIESIEKFIL